jgi:alpha-ketoglutarate-dependent sulfate ester dioxygenase
MTVTATPSTTTATAIDVRPLTAVIGAELHGVDLREPLSPEVVAEIKDALLKWRVVFFRGQDINPAQQIAFGRYFGEVTPAHPLGNPIEGYDQVKPVDADRQRREVVGPEDLGAPKEERDRRWHTDITPVVNPAAASILRAVVVPEVGGDTMWTNLVAAYQGLSAPIRDLVDRLHAVHSFGPAPDLTLPEGTNRGTRGYASVHPVVRVHPETGERGLFVSPNFTRYIVGLSKREGTAILELLFTQLARPEYTVRFRWAPRSIAFWDNRATAHLAAVDVDHADYERYLERITLTGDVPVGPDGYRSQSLVGGFFG